MKRLPNTGTLASIAAAIAIEPGATRVQLFPAYGTWKGRNGLGPYSIADKAAAEAVIAATMAAQGPVDLHFDYDHQAALAPAVAGTAKAAGWIKNLSAEDDGIWAEVEWTASAASAIREREYRYASPYFLHDKAGRVTRIVNAALTNTPNFNLGAIAASALTGDDMDDLEAIAGALGLPAETTRDAAIAKIGVLLAATTSLATVATAIGLAADAEGAAIASGVAVLKAGADAAPDPAEFVPMAQFTAATTKLTRLDDERAERAIASAVQAGKLAPAAKAWGLALFKKDEASFAGFMAVAPALLAEGASLGGKPDPKSDDMSDEERAIASSMGVTPEQFLAARKEMAA